MLKFGGTSVANADAIRGAVDIVRREHRPRAVVVSALAGVTDGLLRLLDCAAAGETAAATEALDDLRRLHLTVAAAIDDRVRRRAVERWIDDVASTVAACIHQTAARRACTADAYDQIAAAGELWSSRLVAGLMEDSGLHAEWIDARRVVRTDDRHTCANPDPDLTAACVAALVQPQLQDGRIVVLGGFVGSAPDGATTTIGRGGSDWSAALIGACLHAREIQIWTDVDGVLTADPRLVEHARVVPFLSYGEAYDLAYFGAKVLHPGTVQPAVTRGIPLRVLNSRRPDATGSLISPRAANGPARFAALACRSGVTLLEITSHRRPEPSDFVTRVFDALRRRGFEAALADLSGSRLSIAVTDASGVEACAAELAPIAEVCCRPGMAMICSVGERLRTDQALATDVLATLDGVPLHLISRPSGGRTIAVVIDAAHARTAMSELHERFFGDLSGAAGLFPAAAEA